MTGSLRWSFARHACTLSVQLVRLSRGRSAVRHALLTPLNHAISMGYRADRRRTRAPINIPDIGDIGGFLTPYDVSGANAAH